MIVKVIWKPVVNSCLIYVNRNLVVSLVLYFMVSMILPFL